jgi:hypothetical protein
MAGSRFAGEGADAFSPDVLWHKGDGPCQCVCDCYVKRRCEPYRRLGNRPCKSVAWTVTSASRVIRFAISEERFWICHQAGWGPLGE